MCRDVSAMAEAELQRKLSDSMADLRKGLLSAHSWKSKTPHARHDSSLTGSADGCAGTCRPWRRRSCSGS